MLERVVHFNGALEEIFGTAIRLPVLAQFLLAQFWALERPVHDMEHDGLVHQPATRDEWGGVDGIRIGVEYKSGYATVTWKRLSLLATSRLAGNHLLGSVGLILLAFWK